MWYGRLAAVLVVLAAPTGAARAGSPEADRMFELEGGGLWFICCGLPLLFGSVTVMIAAVAIRDARKPKP